MYYIKCDSAHDGKSSVLVNKTHNDNINKLLERIDILEITINLGDEIYKYGKFPFEENIEYLKENWNLFNSSQMEMYYSDYLTSHYKDVKND